MGFESTFRETPRPVAPPLAMGLLFGGTMQQLGWVFVAFGMLFVWVFSGSADVGMLFESGELLRVRGVVLESERTNASENRRQIWKLRFVYELDGEQRTGVCYGTGKIPDRDAEVDVEIPADDPDRARIAGFRCAPMPAFVFFFPLLFPGLGTIFVAFGLRKGLLRLHLARNGLPAEGRFHRKEPTNVRINRRTVYALFFRFVDENGTPHEIVTRTHEPERVMDDAAELLLYDPADPERAELVDALPGSPRWGDGGLRLDAPSTGWRAAVLPALTLFGHGSYALLRLLAR